MPKKPTAPVHDDQPDTIDDDTFIEWSEDEERLNAALDQYS